MEVRRAEFIVPTIEHEGTCSTVFFYDKGSLRKQTEGTYLEYISEFTTVNGAKLASHRHNSHEYYYILSGSAVMQINEERRRVQVGDLIYIPPNAAHSIEPATDGPFRAFAFAVHY
jgi:mannose-6-phosphate isomerase-like protein (cupin superfamily)